MLTGSCAEPESTRVISTSAVAGDSATAEGAASSRRGDSPSSANRWMLAGVWLAAAAAPAFMAVVGWSDVARLGSAPGGDMVIHATSVEWLRTLAWWDWRGWSDWFFGGQATGVNYPPLGYVWMRITDPVHGQMAAVLVALVVLLPWGAVVLARAVGFGGRRQCASVALGAALAVWAGQLGWTLSGFHSNMFFFGAWTRMLAAVIGLFAAASAARGRSPVACGVLVGVAALFKVTVVPGIVVVCAVLVLTSGLRPSQVLRWTVTVSAAAVGVCAWWLVPFVAGWGRLVHWDVPLSEVWGGAGQLFGVVIMAGVAVATVAAARRVDGSRRLALAAGAALLGAVAADLAGYQAAYHWLAAPILIAVVAAAGLVPDSPQPQAARIARPVVSLGAASGAVVVAVLLKRPELLAVAVALALWRPGRVWAWGGGLAWFGVLLWVPLPGVGYPVGLPRLYQPDALPAETMQRLAGAGGAGTVQIAHTCGTTPDPWLATRTSGGRIRPLSGLNRETVASAEFILAPGYLHGSDFRGVSGSRPHWLQAWDAAGRPDMAGTAASEALGARWSIQCEADDDAVTVSEGPGILAEGVRIVPYRDEDSWHQAAVQWWVAVASESEPLRPGGTAQVPVLWPDVEAEGEAALVGQAARGVSLHTEQDRLYVMAESAGWAWVRVSWDPWWFADDGVPLKGGPGHLVVWVEPGVTELRWYVPGRVDATAVAVTALSLLLLVAMVRVNRREGWDIDPDRPRPTADAVNRFADAADRRLVALGRHARSFGPTGRDADGGPGR